MAQAKYGDMKNWDVNDNYHSAIDPDNPELGIDMAVKFVETYLTPYLKYTRASQNVKLNALGYSNYYTKNGQLYYSTGAKPYVLELNNGVTLFIGYNGNSEIYSLPIIFVDINGKTKPNVVGRDFFMFELDSISTMKLKPCGIGDKREKLLEACSSGTTSLYGNLRCTGLIAQDGWEIKDDYPW